jgi:hypothetical protein
LRGGAERREERRNKPSLLPPSLLPPSMGTKSDPKITIPKAKEEERAPLSLIYL